MQSLSDRQKEYEDAYNLKLIRRIPVIIRLSGRKFSKLTREVVQPFCASTATIMAHTTMELCKQIDGAVFGYQFFDEINIIVKNNQNENTDPWFGNKYQEISSAAASIATFEFNNYFWNMESPPPLTGGALFKSITFATPDVNEAINNLVWRQQICGKKALEQAALFSLTKKYGRKKARGIIFEKTDADREAVLWDECQIEYESDYPIIYKRGFCCYPITAEEEKKNMDSGVGTSCFF